MGIQGDDDEATDGHERGLGLIVAALVVLSILLYNFWGWIS